jgi:hypothetical protein
MNKLQPVALLATGKLMRSFVVSAPGFRERIGPVKASSLRVASRITNTLQAGFPVADCAEIGGCPAIFICVPDEALPRVMLELADSPLDWAGRTVVLVDSIHTSESLGPVAACGAHTASLNAMPNSGSMVLAEGHRTAIANLRPLFGRFRLLRIEPWQKANYFRALKIAHLCGPLAAIAGDRLRESGLTAAQAKSLVQSIFHQAIRDYMKSGRKVLSTVGDVHGIAALRRALNAANL